MSLENQRTRVSERIWVTGLVNLLVNIKTLQINKVMCLKLFYKFKTLKMGIATLLIATNIAINNCILTLFMAHQKKLISSCKIGYH